MRKYLNFNLLVYIISFLLISASVAYGFTGPGSKSPGSGSGAISADSNGNISIGGTATSSYSIYVPGNTLYGIRAHGSTMGGRFEDTDSSARGYVGYGDYDFYGNGTGLIQSTGSVRAPIFYDSDNTNYFINPSATGLSASFAGSISIGTTTASNDFYIAGAGSRHFKIESTTDDRTGFNLIGGGVFWEFNGHEDGYFRIREDGVETHFLLNKTNGYVGLGMEDIGIAGASELTRRLQLPNAANASGRGIANDWETYSSIRYKENVNTLDSITALDKIMNLNPVSFTWKEEKGGSDDIGFIAEEVGTVIPEAVTWDENGEYADGLSTKQIISYLTKVTQEQQKKIEDLEKRLSELEK